MITTRHAYEYVDPDGDSLMVIASGRLAMLSIVSGEDTLAAYLPDDLTPLIEILTELRNSRPTVRDELAARR